MVISNNQEPNPPLILPWGEVLLSTLLGTLGGHTECVKTFSSLKNLFFTLKNIKNYLRMIFFFSTDELKGFSGLLLKINSSCKNKPHCRLIFSLYL